MGRWRPAVETVTDPGCPRLRMTLSYRSLIALGGVLTVGAGCGPEPCPYGSSRRADGLCYLTANGYVDTAQSPDTDSDSDTDNSADTDHEPGVVIADPIRVVGFDGERETGGVLAEWTDAAILSSTVGAICGVAGVGLVDLGEGTTLAVRPTPPCLRVAEHDGLLVASDRRSQLTLLDVRNPPEIREAGFVIFDPNAIRHEDIAVHGGRIIVGWHGLGARIYDPDARLLGTLPATDAFAVGLHEDRAVISDGEELVLWDVTDPSAASELSRVPLPGEGRDIEFDGARVAVAMGGAGVGVWDVQDDTLVARGSKVVPGAGLSVALDGDDVWIGSWEHTVLLEVREDGLATIGHETPRFSAMGIAAAGGTALVADWHGHMTLEKDPEACSPEIILGDALFFSDADPSQRIRIENHGEVSLEWSVTGVGSGFSVSDSAVTVSPGGVEVVQIEGPPGHAATDRLTWRSNDADEPSGEISLVPANQGVGAAHADFTLQGFTWPDRDASEYTLSAHQGKVVVLDYFALF